MNLPSKEIWYSPEAKEHRLVEFAGDNEEDALNFAQDVVCALRKDNGELQYYFIEYWKGIPAWEPFYDDNDPGIPSELKALCLILL